MCFRSGEGRAYFCDGLSIMESMRADGENLYEGVPNVLTKGQGQFKTELPPVRAKKHKPTILSICLRAPGLQAGSS